MSKQVKKAVWNGLAKTEEQLREILASDQARLEKITDVIAKTNLEKNIKTLEALIAESF